MASKSLVFSSFPRGVKFLFLMSYSSRIPFHTNPTAIRLLALMDRKKTNLSVAVDVTRKQQLLAITRQLGPFICILKV